MLHNFVGSGVALTVTTKLCCMVLWGSKWCVACLSDSIRSNLHISATVVVEVVAYWVNQPFIET